MTTSKVHLELGKDYVTKNVKVLNICAFHFDEEYPFEGRFEEDLPPEFYQQDGKSRALNRGWDIACEYPLTSDLSEEGEEIT